MKTIFIFLFFFLSCFGVKAQSNANKVVFVSGNHAAALQQSIQNHKPLLMIFSTTWCGFCKKMHQITLLDPKVIAFLNQHFICCEVDAEKGVGTNLAKQFGVSSYPTIVVVDANDHPLLNTEGYHEADDLIATLMNVTDKK